MKKIMNDKAVQKNSLLNKEGFTLIELMIVLFLITLILGLSAVFFAGSMPTNKLNAAARELSATIRHARSLSIMSGRQKTVAINIDAKRFGLEGSRYRDISSDIDIKVIDPLYGDIHNGTYRIEFQPGGAQGGTIVLWNKKREVRVELDPVVGAAVIR
jgi:type II secretion system protein H